MYIMSIVRYFKKIQFIDSLIRRKATGNQTEFARKAHMSKSMLKEYLKEMKELGFPINFCKQRKTYYYEEAGKMVETLFAKEELIEAKQYKGGYRAPVIVTPALLDITGYGFEPVILA